MSASANDAPVARSVDDAGDPFDAVRGETLAQRLDDRNASGDRGLERDHHALRRRGGEDFVAVLREQRLVGGDDMLSGGDRIEHKRACRRHAADQLAHDIDVGMRDDNRRVVGQVDSGHTARRVARAIERARGDPRNADRASRAPRDFLLVAAEHVEYALADRAEADERDLERLHGPIRATRRSK